MTIETTLSDKHQNTAQTDWTLAPRVCECECSVWCVTLYTQIVQRVQQPASRWLVRVPFVASPARLVARPVCMGMGSCGMMHVCSWWLVCAPWLLLLHYIRTRVDIRSTRQRDTLTPTHHSCAYHHPLSLPPPATTHRTGYHHPIPLCCCAAAVAAARRHRRHHPFSFAPNVFGLTVHIRMCVCVCKCACVHVCTVHCVLARKCKAHYAIMRM